MGGRWRLSAVAGRNSRGSSHRNVSFENGEAVGNSNNSFVTLTNCGFVNNGIAVGNSPAGHPVLVNCIVRGSIVEHFGGSSPGNTIVRFSCVEGGWPGDGNVDVTPRFVRATIEGDRGLDDLRLQPGSPCIDAGDNSGVPEGVVRDHVGTPRILDDPATPDRENGSGGEAVVDMGAFEFVLPDDSDYDVDLADYLTILTVHEPTGRPVRRGVPAR